MRVHCKASHLFSDVRCRVCGLGFLVDWIKLTPLERTHLHAAIVEALRKHHTVDQSTKAHPQEGFYLSEWNATAGALAVQALAEPEEQAA